jgi:CRISPR-associated protein Csm1
MILSNCPGGIPYHLNTTYEQEVAILSDQQRALIAYGLELFSQATRARAISFSIDRPPGTDWHSGYEKALGWGGEIQPANGPLPNIFSFVHCQSSPTASLTYCSPKPFQNNADAFKSFPLKEAKDLFAGQDWQGFEQEFIQLQSNLKDDAQLFEGFFHLFRRWASGLPGLSYTSGISLFEQWKAIAGLVFASGETWHKGPAQTFTLVGGDIPGIQDFVYTITSKGATRGLRGRSFFIQLLGDAVIQALLDKFGLSPANIIYAAGGNFMLLAPATADTTEKLQALSAQIESAVLKFFEGDLAVCLAWQPLNLDQVGTHEFADPVSRQLKEKIAAKKQQRFSILAENEWATLFAPQGKPGNKHCVICQRMLGKEGVEMRGAGEENEKSYRCPACEGFQQLAGKLAAAKCLVISAAQPAHPDFWQHALFDISKHWYRLESQVPSPNAQTWVYFLNQPIFAGKAHGYRLVANATPRVTRNDLQQHRSDPNEPNPNPGDIRSFSQMAEASEGVKRVGVLRMDVDNLGSIMVHGLSNRSLPATSALSSALDRFFTGWLNGICVEINQSFRPEDLGERIYVIYAGGDDLFAIGAWDLMPKLAYCIQKDLSSYTGQNPALHISGGISQESRKFPLYQAAERAGEAEGKAKAYQFNGQEKDSLCFLDEPVRWSEWEQVLDNRDLILQATSGDTRKALLQILQNIYLQYLNQQAKHPADSGNVDFGPWMWRAAYALTRLNERVSGQYPEAKEAIRQLQIAATTYPSIRYVALAARWVELLSRKD